MLGMLCQSGILKLYVEATDQKTARNHRINGEREWQKTKGLLRRRRLSMIPWWWVLIAAWLGAFGGYFLAVLMFIAKRQG